MKEVKKKKVREGWQAKKHIGIHWNFGISFSMRLFQSRKSAHSGIPLQQGLKSPVIYGIAVPFTSCTRPGGMKVAFCGAPVK